MAGDLGNSWLSAGLAAGAAAASLAAGIHLARRQRYWQKRGRPDPVNPFSHSFPHRLVPGFLIIGGIAFLATAVGIVIALL